VDSQGRYYPASEAARVLDASESATRRYASLYESLYGPMPRDKQKRRLWTHEAVEALRNAKALLDAGKVISIQAGLEALRGTEPEALELPPANPPDDPLRVLLERLEAMQSLEAEIKLLRRQLEAPSKREAELEQMNSYLMRELERYQKQAETPPADPFSPLRRLYRWLYRKE
jgi:DNA-binding transcriptional MerR regulator